MPAPTVEMPKTENCRESDRNHQRFPYRPPLRCGTHPPVHASARDTRAQALLCARAGNISLNPLKIGRSEFIAVADIRKGRTVVTRRQRPQLDRYDVAILSALTTNTRLTTVELAQRVHLSRTAVSRRITALKRMNVLSESADVLNYRSIGFGVRAIVELRAPSHTVTTLREELLKRPEVLSLAVMAGSGLLCLEVIAFDMTHMHEFVHSLQTKGDTTTKIIFDHVRSELTLKERMQALNGRSHGRVASA